MQLNVTNTGTAAAQVTLTERPGDFQIASARGEPWSGLGDPPAAGWQSLPDYPVAIRDHVAGAYGGKIYSFGGVSNTSFGAPVADSYVYDPSAQSWSRIARIPLPRQEAVGAFIGDKFYMVDGATGDFGQQITAELDIYDATTNTWSTGALIPVPEADAAAAVLDGQLYVVGGCDTRFFCGTTGVLRYDPDTDTWQRLADYPSPESWLACGAVEAMLYCAGGTQDFGNVSRATYAYDPAADTWTRRADVPMALWEMGYGVANGKLLISSGVNNGLSTNKGFAYDAVADSWTPLLVRSDTPYGVKTVSVRMQVDPPPYWGKVTGTVTGTSCDGTSAPLAGASVWIAGRHHQYTLTTDTNGRYALWLDERESPLQLTAGGDGWVPKVATVPVRPGRATVQDMTVARLVC